MKEVVSRTYSLELVVVVEGLWGVSLDGGHIQRGAERDNKEQRDDLGQLLHHAREVHAVKVQVLDVKQAVYLPGVPRRLRKTTARRKVRGYLFSGFAWKAVPNGTCM